MSRVEVTIMGQSLVLSSPDGEEDALRDASQRVDAAMCRIRDAGKVKARERIAILASLNLVFEMANGAKPAATEATTQNAASPDVAAASAIDQAALKEILARLDDSLADDDSLIYGSPTRRMPSAMRRPRYALNRCLRHNNPLTERRHHRHHSHKGAQHGFESDVGFFVTRLVRGERTHPAPTVC